MKGSIFHENSSWCYQVTLGKKPNGKRNQKKKRGFKTKKEAERALRKIISDYEAGLYIEPSNMPFQDLAKEFMIYKKRKVSDITLDCYEYLFNSIILPEFGQTPLKNITSVYVNEFYNTLHFEKKYKGSTLVKIHDLLKGSFDYALKMEKIQKNPFDLIDRPKKEKKYVEVWNATQIKHFLATAENTPYFLAYYLALVTGMRQGEILGLRWQDIDFKSGNLQIVQTLKTNGELKRGAKNNFSVRSIILDQSQLAVLARYKEKQNAYIDKNTSIYTDNDLVVASGLGTPINPSNLRRNFNSLIEKAQLPSIRFHDLRHSHATLLLTLNENPKVVAERLGHNNVRTTLDTYSHLLPNMQQKVASKIARILDGNQQNEELVTISVTNTHFNDKKTVIK